MKTEDKIARKLKAMKEYVDFLGKYRNVPLKKLEGDYLLRSAIERNFQLALETILDIGEIVIAERGLRKPEEYREIIEILGESNILPKEFAKRFAMAAGFRNILVHKYEEIDVRKLHENLKNLKDFSIFAKFVAKSLKNKPR